MRILGNQLKGGVDVICGEPPWQDFGKNNTILSIKTHLDHLLNPGDYALGSYEEKDQKKRGKPSSWKLI
ncbi:hypothetical protein VNO80_16211 [Phaseolus coccineus]|uniref:60S ribosomal export protein NMD3 OB-fold domain-containing protein n=1 Tax=Phaseolus coccineus TaxID=3886 RepID=A0AAN9R2Z2_PHACN